MGVERNDEFVQVREFAAPRELVWRAWTEAGMVAKWWGPHVFTATAAMDVRAGGKYRFVMHGMGAEHPLIGEYLEVARPERLVMTMDHSELPAEWHDMVSPGRDKSKPGRLDAVLTLELEEMGEARTRMTIRIRFESAEVVERLKKIGMAQGWVETLEKLEKALAG